MARPKKELPKRKDGRFVVQKTIGHRVDGTPIRKCFYSNISKEDAKRKGEEFLNKPKQTTALFKEWAENWLYTYKEPNVRETTFESTYRRPVEKILIPYFGYFELRWITPSQIQEFFNEHSKKYSQTQLDKLRLCLKGIFETAIENDLCEKNPCKFVKAISKKTKTEKQVYSEDEIEDILKKLDQHKYGYQIRLLLQMGLRESELCGLKWEDIDLEEGYLSIKRACTDLNGIAILNEPKNEKSKRTIPIPKDLLKILRQNAGKGFVVQSENGKLISSKNFQNNRYKRVLNACGIERQLNPHELRHTCGTLLYNKTHDIYAVSRFLGHSSINITTKLYVHNTPESLRAALFADELDA